MAHDIDTATLLLRIAELEGAIAPFAACGDVWTAYKAEYGLDNPDKVVYWAQHEWDSEGKPDIGITVADLIEARRVFDQKTRLIK